MCGVSWYFIAIKLSFKFYIIVWQLEGCWFCFILWYWHNIIKYYCKCKHMYGLYTHLRSPNIIYSKKLPLWKDNSIKLSLQIIYICCLLWDSTKEVSLPSWVDSKFIYTWIIFLYVTLYLDAMAQVWIFRGSQTL